MDVIIPIVIAVVIPLIVFLVFNSFPVFRTINFRLLGVSFLWGFAAFVGAYVLNRTVYFQGWVSYQNLPRYFAPVAEELLKAAIIHDRDLRSGRHG